MKRICGKRIWAMVLTLCLLLGLIPVRFTVEAEAVSGVNSLTCSGFISNPIARKYIDTMMKYYINNNSNLQTTLNNGLSVVFMFEGGSDNYWSGSAYQDVLYSTRNQAVVIVVQLNSSGNAYIPFYSENCSSVPDDPDWCTYNVGNYQSTTLMDGIYPFYTWNHTGPYAAFQISASSGYYTPSNYPNGQVLGASGINIHTRNLNNCGGKSVGWCRSAGCQLIGSGYDTSNVFNQFMKVVGGITWNSWINYSSNTYNTWATTGTRKGYYVLDRQLGMMGTDGTQYGSGSLINLYNRTALTNICAKSTTAKNNSGFALEYVTSCDAYAAHCEIEASKATPVNSQPCKAGTNDSATIENAASGDRYTAIGLYRNTGGNLWYQVVSKSGKVGYMFAGHVSYVKQLISDITLSNDATYPNGHVYDTAFYVNGTISSKYNALTSVACYVYQGFGISDTAIIGASDTPNSNTYDLYSSKVDDDTWMATIAEGNYTYCLFASYTNYYAADATTLKSNSGTLTLMEEYFAVISAAVNQSSCKHTNTTHVLTEGGCTGNSHTVTVCSTCGLIKEETTTGAHSYGQWVATKPPTCTEKGTLSKTCSACGDVQIQPIEATGHSCTTKVTEPTCSSVGYTTYTCTNCGISYRDDEVPANDSHSYRSEVTKPTCTAAGYTTYTCTACGKSYKDNSVAATGHKYTSSVVTEPTCTEGGYTTYTCTSCGTTYKDNLVSATGHKYSSTVTKPTCTQSGYTTYTCTSCKQSYTDNMVAATGHSYKSVVTAPTCTKSGYTTYTCSSCKHSYTGNLVSATGHSYKSVVTKPTCTTSGYTTLTCVTCGNSTTGSTVTALGHSYVNGSCSTCGAADPSISTVTKPTLTLSYPTLSFEDQIQYNVYFTATNTQDVVAMGLVIFDSKLTDGTIADAVDVVGGYVSSGNNYMVHTRGIPAKNLGDAVYFKVCAKLSDGSYVYSDVAGYNAVAYAKTVLSSSTSSMKAKALMVAMLNYGAVAQEYFGYKTDSLMNAFLSDAGKALVSDYDESMVDPVVQADSTRGGHFVMNKTAFTNIYPTVSFEGAFSINYYLVNGLTPDSGITFCYWDAATYESADKLTTANATGILKMTQDGDRWYASVDGIAAKDMDKTIYIAAIYKSGGTAYTTSVIAYSLGKYCETIAARGDAFGAATAVYGYYANQYFLG